MGPMNKQLPIEFIYQLFSLIIAVILVHAIYVSIIRPNAAAVLEEQAVQMNTNPNYVPERSVYVVIRDLEQERQSQVRWNGIHLFHGFFAHIGIAVRHHDFLEHRKRGGCIHRGQ